MKRNIVKIDQKKCNGCGRCVSACHERAIELNAQGKAVLIKEDYCDGLGDCLPACPMDAITIEERETVPYDESAVKARIAKMNMLENEESCCDSENMCVNECDNKCLDKGEFSYLSHWPVQIRLAGSKAEYFENADLLVAADCSAYAYGNFHMNFMKDRVTVVGCPKLDSYDYEEKFYEIFMNNNIKSVTLVRMEVPCCGGMERAVLNALERCGKFIPKQIVVLSLQGDIIRK